MKNQGSNKKPLLINPFESLKDSLEGIGKTAKKEVVTPFIDTFIDQIAGRTRKFSGEIERGEALNMKEVISGTRSEYESERAKLKVEKVLLAEESVLVEKKKRELSIEIHAIHEELVKVVQATPKLTQELQIAAFQAPADVSSYELFFLKRIFEFIKSFRIKMENANEWLFTANKRARAKNVWGANYKKYGAKYLLSGEHYSQRSAA